MHPKQHYQELGLLSSSSATVPKTASATTALAPSTEDSASVARCARISRLCRNSADPLSLDHMRALSSCSIPFDDFDSDFASQARNNKSPNSV
eukprot:CAMPEP_0184427082 /NCGR_PEP_ID=MMETSP0738-20130409/172664_1 /TAXON_ID=385413 /ORGANISM="Thalassiosira miniscula, Strain CCMP1093" /LENGTH=92 /DNA_ID=CAMNT_0026790543 /DNA_START=98 /DNA_END=376 /DNA_ORIENTATION=+